MASSKDQDRPRSAAGDALVRGLNQAQHDAVVSPADRLRILAGAGSGKTRVLTHRIAYRAAHDTLDPRKVLAVTFTRKAAGELRERLAALGLRDGVHAGTFHAIAYAQLRQRWEERNVTPPELLDRKVGFIARLMGAQRGSTTPLDVTAELEWAAARCIRPEQYESAATAAHREPPVPLVRVAEIFERFVQEKRRRRLVDFDDLLRLATRDLTDPVYAAARHWRFRHLFVDEFQDVNPLQQNLLEAWLGADSDVCIVGDPNQAIYAWNGADARYLTDFERYFPGGETVTLEDNYRSTPQILAVANSVLGSGPNTPIRLRPHRPDGAVPTVKACPDEAAEGAHIARAIRDNHPPGSQWGSQAVLVRTNAQAATIAEALSAAKIPHRVRGGGDLLEQPEIRSALTGMRRATSLQVALGDVESEIRSNRTLTDDRVANLNELVRLGREYGSLDPDGGVPGFLSWVNSALRGEDRAGTDAVEIVTFHAAKGLEWPIVHLAGLEEGYVPIHHAKDVPDELDEERRLLYVALTRARDQLHCTWSQSRTFGSRSVRRSPSRWLEVIEMTVGQGPRKVDRVEGAARARAARASLPKRRNDLDGADQALFEALRIWRRNQARDADVPAYVIFNDATLTALATRRPLRRSDLLRIPGIGPAKAQRFGDDVIAIIESAG